MSATISFSLAGSGGLGKSSGARAVAQTLATKGLKVVLVDGNPGQQSQRAFLRIPDERGLEDIMFHDDITEALVMPGDIDADFALLPGPTDPLGEHVLDMYGSALIRLRREADMIIVDADRTDPRQWDDHDSFSGGLIRPFVQDGGAKILFRIGQTGSQLDDGLAALDAISMPDRVLAVAQTPPGLKPRKTRDWERMLDGLAGFAGSDMWDEKSARRLDSGQSGWPMGREPAWVARACVFCGADPQLFDRKKEGLWRWNR